ncbi:sensor histidine kinase [Nocardioides okcheonensis]|uniref:sensor histidine kinase n=1 Tax=Nocardioides okcheonensis TaxID=2894081 RepID=UPI001E591594|nr:histidine kinase [Nocardioides okcheonensis]UFN45606.1 histidine kinase [Nocardioides okcheonensis]
MFSSSASDVTPSYGGSLYTWRVTTAVRVFGLALASGIVLSDERSGVTAPLLAALVVVAVGSAVLDWSRATTRAAWVPLAEMLLAAIMLASAGASPGLYAYLAAPPVVAGVRHGVVTVVNTAFVGGLGLLAAVAGSSTPDPRPELVVAAPWVLTGLGAGLLASWQSRSIRDEDARRAPYRAAHQLVAQLHGLARRHQVGLDTAQLAADLETRLRRQTGATASAVYTGSVAEGLVQVSSYGDAGSLAEQVGRHADARSPGVRVLAIQGTDGGLGFVALSGVLRWNDEIAEQAAEVTDNFALRIDTAVLFDEVRRMATSEERNRLAREMHDGVAQEIVALGYVVDEIESISDDPQTRELAASLRQEITRVVSELRYSIFDLRHQLSDHRLSGALTEHVRGLSTGTDLQVHLSFDESGKPLPPHTETELLRIAQEAISNVRRHAGAQNLWVAFCTDGVSLDLRIEDDGIGNAAPRDLHWGLQTMAERAAAIGAALEVCDRDGGGTRVHLTTSHCTTSPREGSLRP